jgi:hypothetical protein
MVREALLALLPLFHAGPAPAPSSLDGDWTGLINGGGSAYYVGVTVIAGGSAIVHYSAPYNCDGTWHELSSSGNTYTYRETIVHQDPLSQKCADGNTIVVSLGPANDSARYDAATYSSTPRGGAGSNAATGPLQSATASDPPGWNAPP